MEAPEAPQDNNPFAMLDEASSPEDRGSVVSDLTPPDVPDGGEESPPSPAQMHGAVHVDRAQDERPARSTSSVQSRKSSNSHRPSTHVPDAQAALQHSSQHTTFDRNNYL